MKRQDFLQGAIKWSLAALLTMSISVSMAQIGQPVAGDPERPLADRAAEKRAGEIFKKLRCVVCQSQSIDDSAAQIARQMRERIRHDILAGRSDNEIIAFLTTRYGDVILLQPRFVSHTALLWFAGPLVFLTGLGAVIMMYRRGRRDGGKADAD